MLTKPKKKKVPTCLNDSRIGEYQEGYNQCWDDREAWLPSKDEIIEIMVKNRLKDTFIDWNILRAFAKAIAKRIRDE